MIQFLTLQKKIIEILLEILVLSYFKQVMILHSLRR